MQCLKQEVIQIVLRKLNSADLSCYDIEMPVEEVEQVILNYCNINIIPRELKYTWANMAIDLYNYDRVSALDFDTSGDGEINFNDIQKIELGDSEFWLGNTQRTSKTATALKSHTPRLDNITMNYAQQLNKFRRVVW